MAMIIITSIINTMEITNNHATETEHSPERRGISLGRLEDLGLGNPDGIPSVYADADTAELERVAQADAESLAAV